MKLRYRGDLYEYYSSQPISLEQETVGQIWRSQQLQPKVLLQSVWVLRYRGLFYLRDMPSSHPRLSSTEAVPLDDNTQLEDISQDICAMHIQGMGFLYKLYCLGWRNGSLKCLPALQHWLLSIFLYYRRGYTEGSEWRQQYGVESQR